MLGACASAFRWALSRLAYPVTVYIGGMQAKVTWAGLSAAGLCQLNVTVPASLADGDAGVVAEIAGARTQANVFLTVAR